MYNMAVRFFTGSVVSRSFTTLIFSVAVALSCSPSGTAGDEECLCYPWNGEVDNISCDDPSLTSIPDCVPSDIAILAIKTTSIPLVAETFQRFTGLSQLYIQYIEVGQIPKDLLKYLRKLDRFQIFQGGVDYVDNEWFMYVPHLRTLEFQYNKLTSLAPDTLG